VRNGGANLFHDRPDVGPGRLGRGRPASRRNARDPRRR
jgi:hypothetical protein